MNVTVTRITIPPMSTIGYGFGTDEAGNHISFIGDHRPMRDIGEAIAEAESRDELPVADVPDHSILSIEERTDYWYEYENDPDKESHPDETYDEFVQRKLAEE